jgi:hypothetical protein
VPVCRARRDERNRSCTILRRKAKAPSSRLFGAVFSKAGGVKKHVFYITPKECIDLKQIYQ